MALERAVLEPMSDEQRAALVEQLDKIERAVVGMKTPGAFADQAYILRRHIKFVREGLTASGAQTDDDVAAMGCRRSRFSRPGPRRSRRNRNLSGQRKRGEGGTRE